MGKGNTPFVAFNRGLISQKALGRVDLDRTRLSAEVYHNWLPKTQGNMTVRPGTKYKGETHNDTGAQWIEFIAATDDVALIELTNDTGTGSSGIARFYTGPDGHNLSLIERPLVTTTVNVDDTGWVDTSTGGTVSVASTTDLMPTFSGNTNGNFEITCGIFGAGGGAGEWLGGGLSGDNDYARWRAANDETSREWRDTGKTGGAQLPTWWQINFDLSDDTGAQDTSAWKAVTGYSVRAANESSFLDNAPGSWRLLAGNYDTGTFATDTGKWTLEHEIADTGNWSTSEKRIYQIAAADTGTIEARKYWRILTTKVAGVGPPATADRFLAVREYEFFEGTPPTNQFYLQGSTRVLNASSVGGIAQGRKEVVVDTGDAGVEHSLYVDVGRGPVTLRVGSSAGAEDYVSEAELGTGYHNLAFTPTGNFHITLQSNKESNKIVNELRIGDTGTLEVRTPWVATDLDNIRYDQSADVIYVDCKSVAPKKIERRGTGRSWSVVEYEPNGPIRLESSSSAKLTPSGYTGNIDIISDVPFFTADRVGGLIRIFQNGQDGVWNLGAKDAFTDSIQVTGIGDTGAGGSNNERRLIISTAGDWVGTFQIERSFDGPDLGFKNLTNNLVNDTGQGTDRSDDTGTQYKVVDDTEDNIKCWYRVRLSAHTSGVCTVRINYKGGSTTGIARITDFVSSQKVEAEVLQMFSDTGSPTKDL
jgi:hypothetical protein